MNHRTSFSNRRNLRAFIASFLAYMMLVSQLAPVALAFDRTAARSVPLKATDVSNATASEAPRDKNTAANPYAPVPVPLNVSSTSLAPSITATKTDTYPSAPGSALPGEIIRYTVTITNNGPDPATNVTLSDTVDPNTAIVGTPKSTPIGFPDTFSVLGNVRIQVPDGASDLLANDRDPDTDTNAGLTITTLAGDNSAPFSGTSTQNGQVTATTGNGAFEYNPAPGFTGTDTFTYITSDADGNSNPVTVTLTVTGLIWFVNSAAGGGGDGRLTSPFNCFVGAGCFDPVAADDPGDNIFLFSGNYTGGLTFLANQKLIGQGASAGLATIAGVTVPSFSDPLPTTGGSSPIITTVGANALTVSAGGIVLRGFTIGSTSPGAKILGNNFGNLTVGNNTLPDVTLNGTGMALNLTNGTFLVAGNSGFSSVTTTTSGAQGIALTQVGGTVAFGSTTVSGSSSEGIRVQQSTADINFGNTVVGTGVAGTGGTNGVSLQSNTGGTRTFGTLTIQNNNGPSNSAFLSSGASGGGNTVAGTTNIANVPGTGNGIDILSLALGTSVSFGATTVNKASPGSLVNLANNAGNISFLSLGGTNTNGPGLVGTENTGSITVTNNTGSLTASNPVAGPPVPALSITKTAAPATPITLNFTALSSTNSGTQGVNLNFVSGNMTTGTTTVNNSTGTGIQVQNTSAGGTMNFGNTNVSGTGVFLNTNAGNVTFGDLDILPDSGERAFQSTNSTGTITTTSGDIATTGNVTLDIVGPAGRTPLNMVLNNLDSTDSNGIGVNINLVSGNFTVNDATLATNISNPAGIGLQVQNTTGGTMNFGNTNVQLSGGTGVFMNANAGAVVFAALNISPDSGQRALHSTSSTGAITTTSGAIATTNNTAVQIEGVSAGSRTPLNIQFTSVATTGGALAPNGIFLRFTSATGAPGGFRVNGNGGVCTAATPTCTGGRITNTSGADNTNNGTGVYLETVDTVILNLMRIDIHPNHAIRGKTVNIFQLNTSLIDGNNGTSITADNDGTENGEGAVRFAELTGSSQITNSNISGGYEMTIRITNTGGTLNRLTVSNTIIGGRTNNGTDMDDAFHFVARNNAVMNLTVTGSTFTTGRGDVFNPALLDSSSMDLVFRGNTVSNNHPATVTGGGGTTVATSSSSTLTYDISCNKFFDNQNAALNAGLRTHMLLIFKASGSTGTVSGTVFNNTFGTAGVAGSGSGPASSSLLVDTQGTGTHTVLIKNNVMRRYDEAGIRVLASDGSATVNATVIGNQTLEPDANGVFGLQIQSGALMTDGTTINARVGSATVIAEKNNFAAGDPGNFSDVEISQAGAAGGPVKVVNLSRAGSASGTVAGVIDDDNNDPANTNTFTFGNVVLVNTIPTLPAAIDQTCTPPAGSVPADRATFVPSDMQAVQSEVQTSSAPTQQVTAPSNNDSITSRPFVSSPRTQTVQQSNAVAATPAVAPIRIDDNTSPRAPAIKKPKPSPAPPTDNPPTPNPPTIGPGGSSITWNVGTLPAGQSVTIVFDVQVENPYSGPAQVSNQGSISFGGGGGPVLTDDPSTPAPSDPTVTPILVPPDVSINNAKAAESAGTMLFTVALSAPAQQLITINYNTADGTATVADGDYTPVVNGSTVFQVGEQIKTVPITILSNADSPDVDENFTVTISANSVQANVVGAIGTGTITVANPEGTLLISEVRTSGPSGATDEFVEIYNNSNSQHTVAGTGGSPGYGVFKKGATCNATPVLIGTIPNGTVIPARGHFLLTGSSYSLFNYGGTNAALGNATLTSDIENDRNVAIYSTTNIVQLSTTTRFDAVGFDPVNNTGNVCDLMREGTNLGAVNGSTLQYSFFRDECIVIPGVGCTTGLPQDTNNNVADFIFADPTATLIGGAGQRLGAPGPQNLASPLKRDSTIGVVLLDQTVSQHSAPNRVFGPADPNPANNSALGTITVRRRVVNNTGAPVTRFRFRVVETTTIPVPNATTADLRLRTSVQQINVGPVNDPATCTASGAGSPPCSVTVQGLTLEEPPTQAMAGGFNSTVTLNLGSSLAAGASVNVQLLIGVHTQGGSFRLFVMVEALP